MALALLTHKDPAGKLTKINVNKHAYQKIWKNFNERFGIVGNNLHLKWWKKHKLKSICRNCTENRSSTGQTRGTDRAQKRKETSWWDCGQWSLWMATDPKLKTQRQRLYWTKERNSRRYFSPGWSFLLSLYSWVWPNVEQTTDGVKQEGVLCPHIRWVDIWQFHTPLN